MKKAKLKLETLTCPSCLQKIEGAVSSLEGIDKDTLSVGFNSSTVKFDFDETKVKVEDVERAIEKLGYEVLKTKVK